MKGFDSGSEFSPTKSSLNEDIYPNAEEKAGSNLQSSPFSDTSSTSHIDGVHNPWESDALKLFNGTLTSLPNDEYARWLGSDEQGSEKLRSEYMKLFNFESKSILASLRDICDRLYMKGESQHLNRIIESFSQEWIVQNPNHDFHDANVVYIIGYALILLNTDIHGADHTVNKKISKSTFVQNTLSTVKTHRPSSIPQTAGNANSSSNFVPINDQMALVNASNLTPFSRNWEFQLEMVLKLFYQSISKSSLKLHIVQSPKLVMPPSIYASNSPGGSSINTLRAGGGRSSNNGSASFTGANNSMNSTSSSIFGRMSLGRLKSSNNNRNFGNSSRIGNPSYEYTNDNGRMNSLGSVFSAETTFSFGVSRQAIGFAGLLWNSMIREESSGQTEAVDEESFGDFSLIEQELANEIQLELLGAPWTKEGLLKYRPYIDPDTGKRYKKKDWVQIFMVVQRGQLKMFRFNKGNGSSTSKGGVVGDGNWMEKAQMLDGFHLCHTIAQELPPPKKAKQYQALWSLTLPQKGLLVFQAGTPEIAREFVYTCNYWAARLSKEPFEEPVSNMEYGWGPAILGNPDSPSSSVSSVYSSSSSKRRMNDIKTTRNGDGLVIRDWRPANQTLIVSDLNEEKQLENLKEYIERAEKELESHNALRAKMLNSFTASTPNWNRAHGNWERKSQYILQQVIRFQIYVDCLERAIKERLENSKMIESTVNSKASTSIMLEKNNSSSYDNDDVDEAVPAFSESTEVVK